MGREEDRDATGELLRRCNAGDREALDLLVERDLPWIRAYARRRLRDFAAVRRHHETNDVVQECVHDVLRHGPRFVLADHGRFRALMATIVLNTLRTKATHHAAARRRDDGDRSLASDSVLYLDADGPVDDVSRPNDRLSRAQEEERVRLAKRLLDGADQDVLHLRTWDRLPYEEVGRRLGVGADAARKRHERALERLTDLIVRLRAGRLDEILRELDRAVTERDGAEREGS